MNIRMLWIRNWDKWQSYHRAAPPWIKLHRKLLRDHDFIALTPAQRGELVCMWMLAADNGGAIPNDAEIVKKLCQLPELPNLKLYEALGFITKRRRHHVVLETETEAETEKEATKKKEVSKHSLSDSDSRARKVVSLDERRRGKS